MKIKAKVAFSGAWNCNPGDIIDRPSDEAARLIAADYARKATKGEVVEFEAAIAAEKEREAALVAQAEKEAAEKEAETVQPAPPADIVVDAGPVA